MLKLALLGALALAPTTARAASPTIGDYSLVLTTTPALVLGAVGSVGFSWLGYYEIIYNADTSNTAWCTRGAASPAPNKAGSFALAPGAFQEFRGGPSSTSFVPGNTSLSRVAATPSGTQPAGTTVQLTVEAH